MGKKDKKKNGKGKKDKKDKVDPAASWAEALSLQFGEGMTRAKDPTRTDFDDGWVGIEPTFQSIKCIKLYTELEWEPGGEDRYFTHPHMVGTVRDVVRDMERRFSRAKKKGGEWAFFHDVKPKEKLDPWKVLRAELNFKFADDYAHDFEVKFGMDPSTFEYGIKPLPMAWLYDERFVEFLQRLCFAVPAKHGLTPSLLNGGGQFHLSAKCYLTGSLLADDMATRLNHPELSTFVMDWPNCDDRALRATGERFAAYRKVLDEYWAGAYHPKATGGVTVDQAYFDRGFEPARDVPKGLMGERGPKGSARDVFQTNFAFGRAARLRAQAIHPGYWQLAHPDDDGYRPDQIMRYSEANLNRLQLAGELHVKSGGILDDERIPELDAPADGSMLGIEASWELRGHMSRSSARDYVEAILLDVHHAKWLQKHPGVKVKASILQDQLHKDALHTVKKHAGQKAVDELKKDAREYNLEISKGRMKSDFIEPETLLFAAWRALPKGERAAIAREVVEGFVERVYQAASADPRPKASTGIGDPMHWHRHRVAPMLWEALEEGDSKIKKDGDVVGRELRLWRENEVELMLRRPVYSQIGDLPPWPQSKAELDDLRRRGIPVKADKAEKKRAG